MSDECIFCKGNQWQKKCLVESIYRNESKHSIVSNLAINWTYYT